MPLMQVDHCLRDFERSVQEALSFVKESSSYKRIQSDGKYRYVGIRRVELFAGLALLRIYLGWEEFIESVFLRYMCGAKASSGFGPTLLGNPETNITSAFNSLLAPGHSYLSWNSQDILRRAHDFFHQGHPFVISVGAITKTLEDIAIVRNRFAHRSNYASNKFSDMIRGILGYIPRGINPGRFLLMTNPAASNLKFIEYYAAALQAASRSIVQ